MPRFSDPSIAERIGMAVTAFLENDSELIEYDVKEEALSHRFAVYLEEVFQGRTVDCEYNKYCEGETKEGFGHKIRPDIIIHRRGTQTGNLLAIEIKKRARPSGWDEKKLRRLTSPWGRKYKYRYDLGLFVGFVSSEDVVLRWFKHGKPMSESEVPALLYS